MNRPSTSLSYAQNCKATTDETSKSLRSLLLSNKKVMEMQIINANLQRKLSSMSHYRATSTFSKKDKSKKLRKKIDFPLTNRQQEEDTYLNAKLSKSERKNSAQNYTLKMSSHHNPKATPSTATRRRIVYSPAKSNLQMIQNSDYKILSGGGDRQAAEQNRFTAYERQIMNAYKSDEDYNGCNRTGMKTKFAKKGLYQHPYQRALLQLIQKENSIILKRQKDLQFWKQKVKILEQKVKQTNNDFVNKD